MDDKGIQVAIGLKRLLTSTGIQTTPEIPKEERATQCGMSLTGSYGRNREHKKWRYDDLIAQIQDKEMLIQWLMAEGLIAKGRLCPMCDGEMSLARCEDRSDCGKWQCRRQEKSKRQGRDNDQERELVREKQADIRTEEIQKLTYWWCQELRSGAD